MDIPLIILDRVLHIGTMKRSRQGSNGGSLEGHCLSVSLCPQGWQRIAKLGGHKLHELRREQGAFIDVHAVMGDKHLLGEILDWARSNNLVKDNALWKAWTFDEETNDDGWRYMLFADKNEAIEQADPDGSYPSPSKIPGPSKKHPGVEQVTVPTALPALAKLTGMMVDETSDATDAAIMAWAETVAPEILGRDIDGLWWRETFDPMSLSAPRGSIFPGKVKQWAAKTIPAGSVDDEDELDAMPDTVLEPATRSPAPTGP